MNRIISEDILLDSLCLFNDFDRIISEYNGNETVITTHIEFDNAIGCKRISSDCIEIDAYNYEYAKRELCNQGILFIIMNGICTHYLHETMYKLEIFGSNIYYYNKLIIEIHDSDDNTLINAVGVTANIFITDCLINTYNIVRNNSGFKGSIILVSSFVDVMCLTLLNSLGYQVYKSEESDLIYLGDILSV